MLQILGIYDLKQIEPEAVPDHGNFYGSARTAQRHVAYHIWVTK
jgi:hypothetical protein